MAEQPQATSDLSKITEKTESQVAIVGIVICLVFTSAGMALSSPVLGAIGLVSIVLLVPFRRPIARLVRKR